jgi:hypothetical protein
MALMHEIYQRVRAMPEPWVVASLVAALPTSDPVATHLIALLLLERHDPKAGQALIDHYQQFPADVQAMVAARINHFEANLRTAITQPKETAAFNAVQIIRRAGAPQMAHLLLHPLEVQDTPGQEPAVPPELRRDAAECLATLCRQALAPETLIDPLQFQHLQTVVDEALSRYRAHNEPAVMQAWAMLTSAPALAMSKAFADPHHTSTLRMRDLVADPQTPVLRRALLSCLRVPTLAAASLRGLHRCAQVGQLPDALRDWHLLLLPRNQQALRRLPSMADPRWIDPSIVPSLEPRQAMGLIHWVIALDLPPRQLVSHLTDMAGSTDAAVRLAALRQLIELSDRCNASSGAGAATGSVASSASQEVPGMWAAAQRFALDPSPLIARLAVRFLIRTGGPSLPRLLLAMVNSPHALVRELAVECLAPLGFGRLWQAWPRLNEPQRLSAGRALIKIDPHFHRLLSEKLAQRDRPTRLRALSIVEQLNQAPFFELALILLAQENDERVASAAVRALGMVQSPAAVAAVEKALEHHDGRVRANAVEALNQHDLARHTDRLMQMAMSDENRPRANAINALMQMRTADALTALGRMLSDERPEHRTSALWLVQTLGLLEVARQVAEMSLADPDPTVKTRADVVVHQLIQTATPRPAAPSLFRTRSA